MYKLIMLDCSWMTDILELVVVMAQMDNYINTTYAKKKVASKL